MAQQMKKPPSDKRKLQTLTSVGQLFIGRSVVSKLFTCEWRLLVISLLIRLIQ